jgi:hypothetical protein
MATSRLSRVHLVRKLGWSLLEGLAVSNDWDFVMVLGLFFHFMAPGERSTMSVLVPLTFYLLQMTGESAKWCRYSYDSRL